VVSQVGAFDQFILVRSVSLLAVVLYLYNYLL